MNKPVKIALLPNRTDDLDWHSISVQLEGREVNCTGDLALKFYGSKLISILAFQSRLLLLKQADAHSLVSKGTG
jgi:hypothetical protein